MRRRLIKSFVLFIATALLFCSCSLSAPVRKTEYLLGTLVSITLYDGTDREKLIDESFSMVRDIEKKLSVNISDSDISVINNVAFNSEVKLDDELFSILSEALEYCILTDGAFDIGLGKLIELWGIGTDKEAVPDMNSLKKFIGFKGYEHIILDDEKRTVRFDDERASLNLGACAKGYAEDKVREFLIENNVTCAILDFGGSITVIGDKAGGGFNVGIASPSDEGLNGVLSGMADISAVTSGDYQRFFIENGVTYHHILDSSTGFPASSGVKSVTVVTESAFKGDCLSTAAFVLGAEKGTELLGNENCGFVIISDGVQVSENLRNNFSIKYED